MPWLRLIAFPQTVPARSGAARAYPTASAMGETMTTSDVSRAEDAGIDRRKLLKMGAWAAPVVVIAAAVPAASASPGTTVAQALGVGATISVRNLDGNVVEISVKAKPGTSLAQSVSGS